MAVPHVTIDIRWFERGNCRGADPSIFYFQQDKLDRDPNPADVARAHAYCNDCPVKTDCLESAIANGEVGYWGDTTDQQRTGYRREAKAHREHGTHRGYSQHRYLGESPCRDCLNGHSAYVKYRRGSRAKKAIAA